ncbi:NAD(P)/FAD-dependent oxidoreductase [Rubrimonas cliftonensis]|uniref:Cytochrome-dependent sulfide dehydrogenase (Flavoprotein) n=1 Tax=Rubrimonas cliftonensis TaxID=89524 RepID=A0A1H4DFW3_9RHOB|nr:NAD(P)/FAD-dependent oxidoreductase [Rubrimonas cliftonensis]SEA71487.1 cytochrome-dependent sulfide dehydrogenase (flavoprotein) [Rubrimonas cliftonensis]
MQTRRSFLGATAAGAAALAAPAAIGQARPRLVVIGGGAGGATMARYVARDAGGAVDVVLIEPTRTYYTCFFSNLYLGGFRDYDSLGHGYGGLATGGVNVVHDTAAGVDRDARTVRLASGPDIAYDALAVAPGIDFRWDSLPGYGVEHQNAMPHAWKGGSQTQLLKAQLEAMRPGGVFVMIAPPNPYRCPPGPYERVSMAAHLLTQINPTAKIIVLDTKKSFSKQALFSEGWAQHYPGMVDWLPPSITEGVQRIDVAAMTVETGFDSFKADVANVIPAQKAGRIAEAAGLTDDSGFCPIVPATMQSALDENVHVLGDAAIAGDMPKSGFSANSQAKAAAMAVRARLTGSRVFPPRYSNTCWSLIATDDGVKVGARYEATGEKIASVDSFISQTGEDAALRKQTYEESLGWYAGITADMFG